MNKFKRAQEDYDNMLPPDYWEDDGLDEGEYDDEEEILEAGSI